MMRVQAMLLLGLALVAVTTAGACKSGVPIVNIEDQAIVRADGKTLTAAQVRRAIILAGTERRQHGATWSITEEKEGHLVGKLDVRGKHAAVVDILYSATRFNIRYRDSSNLDFEKDKDGPGVIHRNYNRWVNDLLRAIMTEIQKVD